MLLLLLVSVYLVVRSELHEVCHVNLVEGGQHGIGVLCALQALGHARPQPGHLHPPAQVSHLRHRDAMPAWPLICIACSKLWGKANAAEQLAEGDGHAAYLSGLGPFACACTHATASYTIILRLL